MRRSRFFGFGNTLATFCKSRLSSATSGSPRASAVQSRSPTPQSSAGSVDISRRRRTHDACRGGVPSRHRRHGGGCRRRRSHCAPRQLHGRYLSRCGACPGRHKHRRIRGDAATAFDASPAVSDATRQDATARRNVAVLHRPRRQRPRARLCLFRGRARRSGRTR
jgi:hypothetical protein